MLLTYIGKERIRVFLTISSLLGVYLIETRYRVFNNNITPFLTNENISSSLRILSAFSGMIHTAKDVKITSTYIDDYLYNAAIVAGMVVGYTMRSTD